MKAIESVGEKYGHLTVLEVVGRVNNRTQVKCKCDCGSIKIKNLWDIKSGRVKSCGCLTNEYKKIAHTKHGMANSRIYKTYHGMLKRCYNEQNSDYKRYGGRGITVCEEWKNDFQAFYKWAVENGYSDDLTIERKNVNKGYSPENCCWIPFIEQRANKENTIYVECDGQRKTLVEWSEELNIPISRLYYRKRSGWTDEQIIHAPKCSKIKLMKIPTAK